MRLVWKWNTIHRGPFLVSAGNFSSPESHSKISNLTMTKLFYWHSLDMSTVSPHARLFRHVHFSVFRYRWTKNNFTSPKSFRRFQETGAPGPWWCCKSSSVSCDDQLCTQPSLALDPCTASNIWRFKNVIFWMMTHHIICRLLEFWLADRLHLIMCYWRSQHDWT